MKRRLPTLIPLLLAALPWSSPAASEQIDDCPRTTPSTDLLGKPFPTSDRWYGSETLAVILRPDGIWRGMGPKYNYRDKLFWWSFGFKPGMESNLQVTARKLDGSAAKADVSPATNAELDVWTMLVMVEFPAPGCWEVTGRYLGQTLSFVVEVRQDEPPNLGAT